MEVRPRHLAPHYRGSGKLTGKVALVTGGDSGIGRSVVVRYASDADSSFTVGEVIAVTGGLTDTR